MRRRFEFIPKDELLFVLQLRQKAARQRHCVLLEDLTTSGTAVHHYAFLGGFEVLSYCEGAWSDLRAWSTQRRDWRLGYFSYDLKNEFEQLSSQNRDFIGFPLFSFYHPRYMVLKEKGQWRVEYLQSDDTEESVRRWLQ
jgi:para-aminobenzoate synthetase component 1